MIADMIDHLLDYWLGMLAQKKISMDKIYIFWESESGVGNRNRTPCRESESEPPDNFSASPFLFLEDKLLEKWPLFHESSKTLLIWKRLVLETLSKSSLFE